eukprot:2825551-Prymnesium_polylepis.1
MALRWKTAPPPSIRRLHRRRWLTAATLPATPTAARRARAWRCCATCSASAATACRSSASRSGRCPSGWSSS